MIVRMIASGIHIGERTHHQDQVITPPSFNPMKRIVNRPGKLTPTFDTSLDIYFIN